MRKLGRFDLELSVIGMGGIVVMNESQDDADRIVAEAVERGVRYFDIGPGYGNAEERLGPALKPYRDQVAVACKTGQVTAEAAKAQLNQSLQRLQTDHFEIYQYHGFTSNEQAEKALGPGGAIETFEEAKEQGVTRLIGFSAHDEDAAMMAIGSGRFDTMLIPLNYRSWTEGGFARRAVGAANERGMGVLALKAMARGPVPEGRDRPYKKCWYQPEDDPQIAELLLRFTLSLPGVTAAIPPGDPKLFRIALDCADRLTPLDDAGRRQLETHFANTEPLFPVSQ